MYPLNFVSFETKFLLPNHFHLSFPLNNALWLRAKQKRPKTSNICFLYFPKNQYIINQRYVEVTMTFFLNFCSINASICTNLLAVAYFEESFQNSTMKV